MRIEDLTKSDIEGMDKEELQTLRNRFLQMNEKWWGSPFWPDCSEAVALAKYRMLMDEYKKREIRFIRMEIDRALVGVIFEEISKGELGKEIEKTRDDTEQLSKFVKFVGVQKADKNPERIVMGIVYEPDTEDSQGDWATEEEIRKAAYTFMESEQAFKINHDADAAIHILESYIAPVDFTVGEEQVKKGSWLLGSRVVDEDVWEKIETGVYSGYSMAGDALRIEESV